MNGGEAGAVPRIFIFPARSEVLNGKPVYFVFALAQVRDILRETPVTKVPFSPKPVRGLALWRNQIIPVLSLEDALEFPVDSGLSHRLIVIRTPVDGRIIGVEAHPAMSIIPLPDARPMTADEITTGGHGGPPLPVGAAPRGRPFLRPDRVMGAYDGSAGIWLVVHLDRILDDPGTV